MSKKLIGINFEITGDSLVYEFVEQLLYVNKVKRLTSKWWFVDTEMESVQKEIFWLEDIVGTELVYSE